jgi:NAD(P)-dependent dehydrogenase (short-subunit alcohol dehydrogenase family)
MANTLSELAGFIRAQYSSLPLHVNAEFCAGKTFIVTGANIGLGYEATKHLVRLGSRRVILAVRSHERGEAAITTIEADTGVRGVAEVWQLDLSSYESIIAFVDRVKQELNRVDAIIENATAANTDWILSEGWESNILVNVLGTLLVIVLLMPHLKRCAKEYHIKPRIVVVTSGLGFTRQVDLSKVDRNKILLDINDSKKWPIEGTNRYMAYPPCCAGMAQCFVNVPVPNLLT